MTKEKVYVSIVIYARNDERTIKPFILKIDEALSAIFENVELIVVDDHSDDRTLEEVSSLKNTLNSNLMVVSLAWKHGVELAMLAGTDIAVGDFIYEVEDTDIFYPVDIFRQMYQEATEKGIDVVTASGNKSSRVSSRLFYKLLNKLSYLKLELETEDLRLITRRALNRTIDSENKVRYRKILYKYSGFKSGNLKFTEIRKRQQRRNTRGENLRIGFDILLMFTNLGIQIGLVFSLIFLLISLGLGIYTIIVFLVRTNLASGWTTLMLFLSFGFSGMFLVMTILCKYLGIILTETQGYRSYTVKNVERITND